MQSSLLHGAALALALGGAVSLAVAQQPSPPANAPQAAQPENAPPTPPSQAGKTEPASQTSGQPQGGAFVNGALAVPGAPANSDTVPAKFSAKNDADDKLPVLSYTFKTLTDDQRRAIYDALKERPAGAAFNADVGVELPASVKLNAMPDELVRRVPQTKDYRYAAADNRVLLVSPLTRTVVGVFHESAGLGIGEGRRTQ